MPDQSLLNMLDNQTAIVTGGNAGIGKAIALKLAVNGARVVIFGTNAERGNQAVEEIRQASQHENVWFYRVDVSKTAEVDATIKQVLEKFGTVDILINNAGITRDQLLMKMPEDDWDAVMDINVKSCYNACRALARSMMKAKKGIIINISSIVGLTGNAGQVNYAASKAAMIGFTKALAKELASRHIRVNCVCPGFIETAMTDQMTDVQKEALLSKIPLERMGQPAEIGNTVLFLASPLSSYMTGQVITVDGGMVI